MEDITMTPQEPVEPKFTRGKYGPIVNFTFGDVIQPVEHPKITPMVNVVKQALRGKSGFASLQGMTFYKNGELIELVDNPLDIPESEKITNLDKSLGEPGGNV